MLNMKLKAITLEQNFIRFGDSSWIGGVHDTMANRKDSVAGEWAVSYHGTNRDAAASIVNSGAYDQGKSKR